ncbi:hypothetical protein ERICIV_00454 [Paenibacillus larvae subsp. larvae]|uniref:Uncharacterized protein n=1 Tax=Paenibacillus larvae subsp. larvae TaxID=147375 RepID=A0A2L1U932_9BACL|nr:hypothetical protein ERICIII_00454 [Paenibacillus larvae subsp. larvae]AVF29449.1 hypothetical protein ERICIV_00454 [Paenibacillus larvae subsp. larvae]
MISLKNQKNPQDFYLGGIIFMFLRLFSGKCGIIMIGVMKCLNQSIN